MGKKEERTRRRPEREINEIILWAKSVLGKRRRGILYREDCADDTPYVVSDLCEVWNHWDFMTFFFFGLDSNTRGK